MEQQLPTITEDDLFGKALENPTDAFMEVVNGSPGGDMCLAYIPVGTPICPEKLTMIKKYLVNGVQNFRAPFEVESIIELENNSQWEKLPPEPVSDFHMLLWHGTDLNGARGIMSTEFRMPPSRDPENLKYYGNGIYFSDRVGKSAYYCSRVQDPLPGEVGYMFLCRVNVGNMFVVSERPFDGYKKLPNGFHSIIANGVRIPDPEDVGFYDKDTVIPFGRTIPNPNPNPNPNPDPRLLSPVYNEYVVYDPTRIDIKCLLKIRFTPNDEFI